MIKKVIHERLDNWQSGNYKQLKYKIDKVDYVSFDIFDTLLKRDVPKPIDVFSIVGENHNIKRFKDIRLNAEKKARQISNNNEITLKDIYATISITNADSLLYDEIASEIEITCPNLEIMPIYKYCLDNKKVILISDMYLPRNVIEILLNKNGIIGYQTLFISNEINKTKADGSLFDYVRKELGIDSTQIMHIGNSFKADYINAKKKGWKSFKISTHSSHIRRKYDETLCEHDYKKKYLLSFINNHIRSQYSEYSKFGYECFGPLLYGFVSWLFENMKENSVEQVFFLARDGYIMRQVYNNLGYGKDIQDYYFEASRRSLRIPAYNRNMSFNDILHELTVPNKTTLKQIFDSFGLDIEKYSELVSNSGIKITDYLKRDSLKENKKFKKIFDSIYDDIITNAEYEAKMLDNYLSQYDFSKKTAVVDIGWGGSMQKYLLSTLNRLNIKNNIVGYYVGLTEKSRENLGINGYKAKGYVFDALNDVNSFDMERPFVGLFETLFLERNGSVKKYTYNGKKVVAERYKYEYMNKGQYSIEALAVKEVQNAALDFVNDYKNSICAKYLGHKANLYFSNLYQVGICPTLDDVKLFGKFEFFNNGSKVYLANPDSVFQYIFKPKNFIRNLFDSQWKIGFLKELFKINLPYLKIFNLLRKISN